MDTLVAHAFFGLFGLTFGLLCIRCLIAAMRESGSTDASGLTNETPWGLVIGALLFLALAGAAVEGDVYLLREWKRDDVENAFIRAAATGDVNSVREMLQRDPTLIGA